MQKVWTPPLRLVFGAATALGLFSALQAYRLSALTIRDGMNVEAGRLLLLNLAFWYVPAAITPLFSSSRIGTSSRRGGGRGRSRRMPGRSRGYRCFTWPA